MNLFVVSLTYKSSLIEVDKHLAAHNQFLRKYYDNGTFICSGPKIPRIGGIILCKSDSIDSVKTIIAEDPFNINNVADFEITEFRVADSATGFESFLK
jgi:uncharacterized protein YciI